MELKTDGSLLESHIRDLLGSAKSKIETLSEEITSLEKENTEYKEMLTTTESACSEIKSENEKLGKEIVEEKEANKELYSKKKTLETEVVTKKRELSNLLEDSDKEMMYLKTQVCKLKEKEKKLKECVLKQKQDYATVLASQHKLLKNLSNQMQNKQQEVFIHSLIQS